MVNVLRQAGAHVVLASVEPELEVRLSGGTILVADTSISECSDQIFDLVALPVSSPNFKTFFCNLLSLTCLLIILTLHVLHFVIANQRRLL